MPRVRLVIEAWLKAFADLSGTRTQIVLMMSVLFALAFLKALRLARTTAEVNALFSTTDTLFYAVLVAWFGGKMAQIYSRNHEAHISQDDPDMPTEDPLARLERLT